MYRVIQKRQFLSDLVIILTSKRHGGNAYCISASNEDFFIIVYSSSLDQKKLLKKISWRILTLFTL